MLPSFPQRPYPCRSSSQHKRYVSHIVRTINNRIPGTDLSVLVAPSNNPRTHNPSRASNGITSSNNGKSTNEQKEEDKETINSPSSQKEETKISKPSNEIDIHAIDQHLNLSQVFTCDTNKLLSHMHYFKKLFPHRTNAQAVEELKRLDITIHCSLSTIQWLMNYIEDPVGQIRQLDINNVIQIIISAEYLQMAELINLCVAYIVKNFLQILKLPFNLNALSNSITGKIANIINIGLLLDIRDREDKFISKLSMKCVKGMLEKIVLYHCFACSKLFTSSQKHWLPCVQEKHVEDRKWKLDQFIDFLKKKGLSWREIYCKIWAHTITLNCEDCRKNFVGSDIGQCIYHSQEPNRVEYPCCETFKFSGSEMAKGCVAKNHRLAKEWRSVENERIYKELIKYYKIIAEPFVSENLYEDYYNTMKMQIMEYGRLSQTNIKSVIELLPINKINDSPSLKILLRMYIESRERVPVRKGKDGKKARNNSAGKKKSDNALEVKVPHKRKSNSLNSYIENTNKKRKVKEKKRSAKAK